MSQPSEKEVPLENVHNSILTDTQNKGLGKENQTLFLFILNWISDVIFAEDNCDKRDDFPSPNFSSLSSTPISYHLVQLLKQQPSHTQQ